MNRIVRENYPVSKLPEDLRKEFPGQDEVTLTVEGWLTQDQPDQQGSETRDETAALEAIRQSGIRGGDFSRFQHLRRDHFRSSAEIDAYLNELRGEWAHRER